MRNAMSVLIAALAAQAHLDADEAREIRYTTTADGSQQPAIFYDPESTAPVPLVVALHTWSGGYRQMTHRAIEQWCMHRGWAYIHPHFRGPNKRPEATGSELVVKDIVSAVAFARETCAVDAAAIYLVGTSGGGYTALLMAGRHPEIWAGVSAWVPISDLRAWHAQGRYVADIVASCGGPPGASDRVDEEYRKRSPITYLRRARGVSLHIHAGIRDGHDGSVPISHSLLAFNEVAEPQDRLTEGEIRQFVERAEVPPHLRQEIEDPSYGTNKPLFRRTSAGATVTIFDGAHELIPDAAIHWIEQGYMERR